ncbi:hypothetical protein [Streptomyces rimosus]|uniref:hypothetical protein n=1 Tax=Streptomyces rimosus TaxID=1927 RepID=UPI00067DF481|nr:hypothetical protein [Streptomyces rimosus]
MRLWSRVRTSSALWAAPFVAAIPLLYYIGGAGKPVGEVYEYAPTVVSAPLYAAYAFAYAAVAALAAWEGGRLKEAGVWRLAPARSRYRIAVGALWPVVVLGWLTVILPVVVALVDYGVWPTGPSLRPVWLAMVMCLAHAVIGFAVGQRVPKAIAAPVLAIGVWVVVSYSVTLDPAWLRNVSGAFFNKLMLGEAVPYRVLLPHVLLTGSIALALALGWARLGKAVLRMVLALAVIAAGSGTACAMAADWGYTPPLLADQAPMACSGSAPRVCVPRTLGGVLKPAQREVSEVIKAFGAAGVGLAPALVSDSLTQGRQAGERPSTARTWRPPLTAAAREGQLRYAVTVAAVVPPCLRPDPARMLAATLWATGLTGTQRDLRKDVVTNSTGAPDEMAVRDRAEQAYLKARTLPEDEQATWYRATLRAACPAGSP